MLNVKWKDIKYILFSVDHRKFSREEREMEAKVFGFCVGSILLILASILLFFGVFDLQRNDWQGRINLLLLASLFFYSFTLLEISFGKKSIFRLIRTLNFLFLIICLTLLVFAYNPFVLKIHWLEFVGWLTYVVLGMKNLGKNVFSNKEMDLLEEQPRDNTLNFSDCKWNKNLGFKGFLLASLFFVAVMVFICLFPYLMDLIRR